MIITSQQEVVVFKVGQFELLGNKLKIIFKRAVNNKACCLRAGLGLVLLDTNNVKQLQ